MAYLDALMPPDEQDPTIAQQLYPWARRNGPVAPPVFGAPPSWGSAPPPTSPAAAPPAVVTPSLPAAPSAGAAMAPVTLGPTAAQPAPPNVPSNLPMQPVNLGPQAQPARPTPAADALAASKPPELHGVKKVLDIIGQARFPGIEAVIPGTPGNYRQQARPLLEKQAAEEAKNTAGVLAGQKDQSEITRNQAEAANLNSEAEARKNPKGKTHPILINGPDGEPTPALQNMLTGEIKDDTGTAIPNARVWEKTPPAKNFLGHTEDELKNEVTSDPVKYPGGWMEGAAGYKNAKAAALKLDKDEADAKRGPKDTTGKDAARTDRSYQFNVKELDEERKPLEATMSKISAATSNIDLKSPQADALLAPQILSLSAGGAGSGLRMNEAEISRILGGRTVWETLKASANKWSTDPNHPQIPEAQRGQMVQILQAAAQKGTLKSSIISWADGALVNTDDVKEHRQIVATARQMLNAVDEGKRVQRNKTTGEFRIAPGD